MMSKEQFEQMMNRLDTLIKISAINAFQGKSRQDVVQILSSLGFSNPDIAMILGTTTTYVANVKYLLRKGAKTKGKTEKTVEGKEAEKSDE
jgi:carbohydrate-binding DOMON domain-containing protein